MRESLSGLFSEGSVLKLTYRQELMPISYKRIRTRKIQMMPSFSAQNSAYLCYFNSEKRGDFSKEFSFFSYLEYFSGIFLGDFSIRSFSMRIAILANCVSYVFFMSPEEQMLWVYTSWNIATMKNPFAFWNLSIMEFPRNAMSKNTIRTTEIQQPISTDKFSASPKPACFCLFDALPKTFFYRRISASSHESTF